MNGRILIAFLLGMLVSSIMWLGVFVVADKEATEDRDNVDVEDNDSSEDEATDNGNSNSNSNNVSYTADFIGKRWNLSTIDGEDKSSSDAYIIFNEDGTVSGNSACNEFSSTFELVGENILFADFISTLRFCEDTNAVETAMMGILDGVTTVEEVDISTLRLSGATGVLVFEL